MTEARNFSVLRASEFLNFSYQRLQYLVSEARFKDGDVEINRLQLGGDTLLRDQVNVSYISMEDYAVAILDEIEYPQHIGQRFSVAY